MKVVWDMGQSVVSRDLLECYRVLALLLPLPKYQQSPATIVNNQGLWGQCHPTENEDRKTSALNRNQHRALVTPSRLSPKHGALYIFGEYE